MQDQALLRGFAAIGVFLAAAGCSDGGTGPADHGYVIEAAGGDGQVALAGAELDRPLRAVVSDAERGEPVADLAVAWEVAEGAGASLSPTSSTTDSLGRASTRLRLGPSTGTYRVRARVAGGGAETVFEAHAVLIPHLSSISPAEANVGETVVLHGQDFPADPELVAVTFDGMRGAVVSATATEIQAIVPDCLPTRTVDVAVLAGSAESGSVPLDVHGADAAPLALAPGESVVLSDSAELACIRLPDDPDALYLVVLANDTDEPGASLFYRVLALAGEEAPVLAARGAGPLADAGIAIGSASAPRIAPSAGDAPLGGSAAGVSASRAPAGLADGAPASRGAMRAAAFAPFRAGAMQQDPPGPALWWESRIRRLERELDPGDRLRRRRTAPLDETGRRELRLAATPPAIGSTRSFQVFNRDEAFSTVTARVEYVSDHAILYQDVDAPAGGFTPQDFENFGRTFDDPVYNAVVSAFGAPSDIDENGRIIILFTPVVNALTPAGSSSYVVGFFYGIDLAGSKNGNGGEVFYGIVPDPEGDFGRAHSTTEVLAAINPVLAHELQHMIHYNQRVLVGGAEGQGVLWLSEALAHMAEDVVADVYRDRGDAEREQLFRAANIDRACRFLAVPSNTSLIAEGSLGTLEERGAQWLFIKYLAGHYGGSSLLGALTRSTLTGVANVESATQTPWAGLVHQWATALWADDAPELDGVEIDPRLTFTNLDMRAAIRCNGEFPLQAVGLPFEDFVFSQWLPAAAGGHFLLGADALDPPPLRLSMTAPRGAPFPADARPALVLLRVR
ncbi:MAG TPA: IPT/TIG domain-containing protein [Longimicrobiales bacterium]